MWDLALGTLIIYSAFIVPVRVGFLGETVGWRIHDLVVDSWFAVDIVLQFLTAYEDELGMLVESHQQIARHYVFSPWFSLDLFSTLPLDLMFSSILNADSADSSDACSGGGGGFGAVKLLRIVRLVRLAKVVRVLKLQQMLRKLQHALLINPAAMQLFQIFAFILFFTHLMGCMWFFATQMNGENNWALAYPGWTADPRDKAICWDLQYKYLASIYWAFTTISTIGYGDIVPSNQFEQVIAWALMFLGSAFFGVILARMTDLVTALDATGFRKRQRLDILKSWMGEARIPHSLHRRLRKYYNYYLDAGVNFGVQQEVLRELCPSLRTEVLLSLNKDMVAHIPFFSGQHPGFVVSVCSLLVPCFALAQEYIFREGDPALQMYFLQRGRVQIRCLREGHAVQLMRWKDSQVVSEEDEVVLDEQEAVSYFGEGPLLQHTDTREASVLTITFCSLFSFSKKDLHELLALFPSVKTVLQRMASDRMERFNKARSVLAAKRMASKWVRGTKSRSTAKKLEHATDSCPTAGGDLQTPAGPE